ncbi:hypothetical protein CLOSTASPAR_00482, partial [[Clostridium] asparagiforme DSM 15981]
PGPMAQAVPVGSPVITTIIPARAAPWQRFTKCLTFFIMFSSFSQCTGRLRQSPAGFTLVLFHPLIALRQRQRIIVFK